MRTVIGDKTGPWSRPASVKAQDLPYPVLRQRLLAQGQVIALPVASQKAAAKDDKDIPMKSLPDRAK